MTETGQGAKHLDVISAPERVAAVLSPIRRRLLQSLSEPDSATGLSRKLGMPRQKINYHLRELERAGFLELHDEVQRRGCIERRVRLTSRAYVISHEFLEGLAADPDSIKDKFSSSYLIAAAGRVIRDVGLLRERAESVQKRLATIAIETEIKFASPADFNSFSEELANQIARLAAKYHRDHSTSGRKFRVVVGSHPVVTKTEREARAEARAHKDKLRRKKQ